MNDSFLEDLGLVEQKAGSAVRDAERYITTRQGESPKVDFSAEFEREIMRKQVKCATESPVTTKQLIRADSETKKQKSPPLRRASDPSAKKVVKEVKISSGQKTKHVEKKVRVDGKLKTVESVDRIEELKGFRSRGRRSGGSTETSGLSDVSSKENSRPSDSSAENVPAEILKERKKASDSLNKKSEIVDSMSLAALGAIKEIVATYTKMESNKVMRMMQELYINSQSNLIKQLMLVTDDLKDLNLSEGSPRYQAIIKENAQLLENVAFLRSRVAELQKSNEEIDKIKQENLTLRARIKELEK